MPEDSPALIDLQNIRVMRGEKVVLDDFSLQIQPSEHVAILGPNGCGKSTLVKTIARELYPVVREGSSMTILGRDRWNVFELRSLLGIVSNDLMIACTTDVKGRDVVISGFFSSTRIFPTTPSIPSTNSLPMKPLSRCRFPSGRRRMFELSSGEAERVLIARALVHKPKALLFDEPSNSLDLYAQHYLRESMRMLAKSGIGIVLVTHDLADIVPEIERIVLISNGRIAADGRKDDVLHSGGLSALFGMKVELAERAGYYHLW